MNLPDGRCAPSNKIRFARPPFDAARQRGEGFENDSEVVYFIDGECGLRLTHALARSTQRGGALPVAHLDVAWAHESHPPTPPHSYPCFIHLHPSPSSYS